MESVEPTGSCCCGSSGCCCPPACLLLREGSRGDTCGGGSAAHPAGDERVSITSVWTFFSQIILQKSLVESTVSVALPLGLVPDFYVQKVVSAA
ncbi:hypothetical protein EYF80_001953 [Liparis tanakae]|uniref:Uncharacterized protein n=1 Tax=Liparis tanakae TaxID=230148 RepID=A0A4Z2JCQ1_9TELE|nr:hypothetical protein EYF80_001953 [Liparis tanakae]